MSPPLQKIIMTYFEVFFCVLNCFKQSKMKIYENVDKMKDRNTFLGPRNMIIQNPVTEGTFCNGGDIA